MKEEIHINKNERRCFQIINEKSAVKFCCCYAKLGNITEAAVMAGCDRESALEWGAGILRKRKYARLTSELRALFSADTAKQVMAGLERLAFGDSRDAVYLTLREDAPTEEEIMKLDLFNVSEIKRVKGGGVEVKLFDRQKALEKMMELAGSAERTSAAQSLLNALSGAGDNEV